MSIEDLCPPERPDLRILESVDSTNAEALRWASAGAPDGACVLADQQVAGRGRAGRCWHSPPGRNVYLSMVMRPDVGATLSLVPLFGAVATREAVSRSLPSGPVPKIKWPNDVLIADRKVAGVLAEVAQTRCVVLGIGINVNMEPCEFPEGLRRPAASLCMFSRVLLERREVLARLLDSLDAWRPRLARQPEQLVEALERDCISLGRRVRVSPVRGQPWIGRAIRIAADGVLEVEDARGRPVRIEAGDVDPLDE
ncbi:MAG: biotin--[acetyl-CoA-carboxylase] ligase [Deltaproteobacteria bacterium]|nr:biotin--[acetyl-CoA-carboxylase] ligase [Deltaproteobacteria bacterium]